MSKLQKIFFIIVVLGQLGVLGFMIAKRMALLENGKKIRIACVPVDPRSLFSGDYVVLNYDISRVDKSLLRPEDSGISVRNKTIYVALTPDKDNKFYLAKEAAMDFKYLKDKYDIVLKGRVTHLWGNKLNIVYGLEQYFVPQKEGLKIEKNIKNTSVEISLSDTGESALSRLFINDKEVDFH